MSTVSIRSTKDDHEYLPCDGRTRITKEYYYSLLGQINRGTIKNKSVTKIHDKRFGTTSYYLNSLN